MRITVRELMYWAVRNKFVGALIVFLLGLSAFGSGVGTTGVPDMASESVLAWLYSVAALFVLGGLDLGLPMGGPEPARAALWVAYFLAPIITTTAIAEPLLRLVRPGFSRRTAMTNHVILVRSNRLGLAYLDAVNRVDPGRSVVVLEHTDDQLPEFEPQRSGNQLTILKGDIRRSETLTALHVDKACRMIVITADDLLNLEGAWAVRSRNSELPIAAHMTDLTLLRPVSRLIRSQLSRDGGSNRLPMVFNTHRIGALYLYENYLRDHFEATGYRDVVVIAGFGKFAQTILELLRAMASAELEHIVIVDTEARRLFRQFSADVQPADLRHTTVDGEVDDPGTWSEVERELESSEATPVYLLASSDQVVNYRAAMLLRKRSEEPRIFARCFYSSEFSESLATLLSIELIAFEDILAEALQDHYKTLISI